MINNKIQELRQGKGITQQELAESIGVTRQTIIAMEKGNYIPSLKLAFTLSNFFSTTVEDIFYETSSK